MLNTDDNPNSLSLPGTLQLTPAFMNVFWVKCCTSPKEVHGDYYVRFVGETEALCD